MLISVVLAVLFLVGLDRYLSYRGRLEFASLDEDCEAFWRLVRWREAHPRVRHPHNHPGWVALVEEAIVARKRFYELHPFLKDKDEALTRLYVLL